MRQILALSGGGYRGLIAANVLATLQAGSSVPIARRFDLIAGTSIGGIIACGLAAGISPGQILAAMEAHGRSIFRRGLPIPFTGWRLPIPGTGILSGRYAAGGLRGAIQAVLGAAAGLRLSQVAAPLLVVAVDRSTARPVVFTSAGFGPSDGPDATLLDVCLATSAAPTYFPEHKAEGLVLIDGGIIANAPDLVALIELVVRHGLRPDELRMLSIGTAAERPNDHLRAPGHPGVLRWFVARGLFQTTLQAQETLAVSTAARYIGDRYLRIDREPAAEQRGKIGMDKTGRVANDVLRNLAVGALDGLTPLQQQILDEMMRHTASWGADR